MAPGSGSFRWGCEPLCFGSIAQMAERPAENRERRVRAPFGPLVPAGLWLVSQVGKTSRLVGFLVRSPVFQAGKAGFESLTSHRVSGHTPAHGETNFRAWRSLASRLVGDQEIDGSNPSALIRVTGPATCGHVVANAAELAASGWMCA